MSYKEIFDEMRKGLETDIYNHKMKCIENDYNDDVNIVKL